jgi:NCS2 family nucleobase:cation symporter-2
VVREEDLQCLADGDRFEGGKLIDCDGKEVPIQASSTSEH